MSPEREAINPRITLDDVGVSEKDCRARTGEIMAIQKETLSEVIGIGAKIDRHKAWHNGQEHARAGAKSAGQYWARMAGLVLAVAVALGAAIWTISKL